MAKKHFDQYYQTICHQYEEMKELLNQIEVASSEYMMSPEQLENIQASMKPIKDTYMTLSYVAYLLNQPNRKEKAEKYRKQNTKKLNSLEQSKSPAGIVDSNKQKLNELGEYRHG